MNKIAYKTEAAAEMIGVSKRTLEEWREQGKGPAYSRLSERLVVYPHATLVKYLDRYLVRTIDQPAPEVGK
ncbi:MAG: hypothetical protein FD177_1039 [Desulfovibrionaceae bacterium]|jgi:hypothetical protein|nr:MAG: hypothetical protein FD177_1039 [Desulfovibrionaceae bacterium]